MTAHEVHFPDLFSWGTSTSAYQIEGGNTNSDWWRFERTDGTTVVERCDDACDSWHGYEEDLDNVEWTLGYRPKFGIVAVDRVSFERNLKPSATWYANATRNFFTTT